jgi:uncharacterized protein DUF1761
MVDEIDINYLAVLVAAAAAWVLNIVWYQALWKPRLPAEDKITAEERGPGGNPRSYVLFIFFAELIMARILADILAHVGDVTVKAGVMWGVLCWTGLVAPVLLTNAYLLGRRGMLGVIELGHWLAVFIVMGAIVGAFGPG